MEIVLLDNVVFHAALSSARNETQKKRAMLSLFVCTVLTSAWNVYAQKDHTRQKNHSTVSDKIPLNAAV